MVSKFELSLFYALSCLRLEGLEIKDKQLEAIQTIYDGKKTCSRGYLQGMANLCVTSASPCLTIT